VRVQIPNLLLTTTVTCNSLVTQQALLLLPLPVEQIKPLRFPMQQELSVSAAKLVQRAELWDTCSETPAQLLPHLLLMIFCLDQRLQHQHVLPLPMLLAVHQLLLYLREQQVEFIFLPMVRLQRLPNKHCSSVTPTQVTSTSSTARIASPVLAISLLPAMEHLVVQLV